MLSSIQLPKRLMPLMVQPPSKEILGSGPVRSAVNAFTGSSLTNKVMTKPMPGR